MAGWQNINVEHDGHALAPIILRVMKAVYRQPVGIDHWWHSPSLSYQVDQGASEPSIVILNLREGQPDNPAMDTHFTINLNTQWIHDKFKDERFPAPTDTLEDLETLRNHVRQRVGSRKAAEERRQRDIRLQAEEKHKALLQARTNYYNRLVKNELVDSDMVGDNLEDEPGDGCVLCGSQKLVSCNGCQIVSCQGSVGDSDCPGYEMDGIETCVAHPTTSYCLACRAISGVKEVLAQCPCCEEWHCRQDQTWCIGRPLPTSADEGPQSTSTTEAAELKKQQKVQPKPLHAPICEPCRSCLDADEELLPFMACSAGHTCWSFGNKICEDCTPEGGMRCSNNHKWYCDDCAAAKPFDGVWPCPNCEMLFCRDCGIERCYVCGASSLCGQCSKTVKVEDSKEPDNRDVGAHLEWECEGCGWKMCKKCKAKGLSKSCDNCYKEVCDECADVDECCECHSKLCIICQSKDCSSCGGWGESKRDEMVQEMAYDMYDYDDGYY